jgi:hypothetical protein
MPACRYIIVLIYYNKLGFFCHFSSVKFFKCPQILRGLLILPDGFKFVHYRILIKKESVELEFAKIFLELYLELPIYFKSSI